MTFPAALFSAIGNCVLLQKSTACTDAQLGARNKSCAARKFEVRERVKRTFVL